MHLLAYAGNVFADGQDTDLQAVRDFLVSNASRYKPEHIKLAGRQSVLSNPLPRLLRPLARGTPAARAHTVEAIAPTLSQRKRHAVPQIQLRPFGRLALE